jgi:TetR/AcrR family transcriptional regulator, transcriptional repressor for nem operon
MANKGTREKIIEAAYVRFYEFGYNGTSVQDIVDLVGVPKGTFYNYFKSKERLALEALNYYACVADQVFTAPEVAAATSGAVKKPESQLARLQSQFAKALLFQQRQRVSLGCLMGNFVAESSALPASFRKRIDQSFNRWIAAIAASLRAAQTNGEIARAHDPDRLAKYLLASWQGALLLMKSSKSRKPLDDFFHFSFEVVLKADGTKSPATKRGSSPKVKK